MPICLHYLPTIVQNVNFSIHLDISIDISVYIAAASDLWCTHILNDKRVSIERNTHTQHRARPSKLRTK